MALITLLSVLYCPDHTPTRPTTKPPITQPAAHQTKNASKAGIFKGIIRSASCCQINPRIYDVAHDDLRQTGALDDQNAHCALDEQQQVQQMLDVVHLGLDSHDVGADQDGYPLDHTHAARAVLMHHHG
jgi:hypothetical protein